MARRSKYERSGGDIWGLTSYSNEGMAVSKKAGARFPRGGKRGEKNQNKGRG